MNPTQATNTTGNPGPLQAGAAEQAMTDVITMLSCARDGLIDGAPRAGESASFIIDHALAILEQMTGRGPGRPDPAPGRAPVAPLTATPAELAEEIASECPDAMVVSERRLSGAIATLNDVLIAADYTLEIQRGPLEVISEALHQATRPENIGN